MVLNGARTRGGSAPGDLEAGPFATFSL